MHDNVDKKSDGDAKTEQVIDFPPTSEDYAPFRRNSLLKRSVSKRGYCALQKKKRTQPTLHYFVKYLRDPFTTLIDFRWRWLFVLYTLSFIVTWFLFGILWWIIAYAHGDLADAPYVVNSQGLAPCVTLMHDFVSSFLFSMETQYTTGYGTRAPTTECPEAIFLLCIQSIFGVLLQSVMVGVVFSKLSRPKIRGESIIFSKKAVISSRNGQLCLMVRLGDERKSHVVGCELHAWIIQKKITTEGEILPNYLTKLDISVDDGGPNLFLLWPVTVIHRIASSSPLYEMSASDIKDSEMEIIISLGCIPETTGQQTEVRCSYTPKDILWGHRFQSIVVGDTSDTFVDYSQFDCTIKVPTSLYSAKDLDSQRSSFKELNYDKPSNEIKETNSK